VNLKWCFGHRLTNPVRKKSFGLVKPSKKQIHIQQKCCDPATELISIFLSSYFYDYMNFFGIHWFNEFKIVYWTSINTSCKKYSTHQAIRYTPLFSVHSYGTTCLRKSANTTRKAWARFFFFFSWVDLMMIHIFYPHKIVVGLTPMVLRYRSLY
jgi:hypothetical protein